MHENLDLTTQEIVCRLNCALKSFLVYRPHTVLIHYNLICQKTGDDSD